MHIAIYIYMYILHKLRTSPQTHNNTYCQPVRTLHHRYHRCIAPSLEEFPSELPLGPPMATAKGCIVASRSFGAGPSRCVSKTQTLSRTPAVEGVFFKLPCFKSIQLDASIVWSLSCQSFGLHMFSLTISGDMLLTHSHSGTNQGSYIQPNS